MKDPFYEKAENEIKIAVYFAKERIAQLGEEKALDMIGKAYQN